MAWKTKIIFTTAERAKQAMVQLKPIDAGFMLSIRQGDAFLVRALTHAEAKALMKAIEDHYHEHDQK